MELLKKHIDALSPDATIEQVREALSDRSWRKNNQICDTLGISRKGKKGADINRILKEPLDKVIEAYNIVAATYNKRVEKWLPVVTALTTLIPELVNVKSLDEFKDEAIKIFNGI